jgi:hypothetical protein
MRVNFVKYDAAKDLLYSALFMNPYPYFPQILFGMGKIWY